MSDGAPLLEVRNLKKYYPLSQGLFKRKAGTVKAVDDVSFTIQPGETFGLVGESGCGKSTIAKSVIRAVEPTDGDVIFHLDQPRNLAKLNREELKVARRHIQLVFQDPFSSLNPRHRVRDIIGEPLKVNNVADGKELEDQVGHLMSSVGLRPEYQVRYPHAFSGGQRQRIGIARALAMHPQLIICDEPVSALDVSVQAQILNLLSDLQSEFGLTYLFVSHDLGVVQAHLRPGGCHVRGQAGRNRPDPQAVRGPPASLHGRFALGIAQAASQVPAHAAGPDRRGTGSPVGPVRLPLPSALPLPTTGV